MSVRPTNEGPTVPILNAGIGYDADANTDDIDPPPDRVPDGVVQTPISLGSIALTQHKLAAAVHPSSTGVTLDDAPAAGSLLVLAGWCRGTATPTTPSGWTQIETSLLTDAFFADVMAAWYKVSDGTETTMVVTWGVATLVTLSLSEWSGLGTLDDSDTDAGSSATITSGTVTPVSTGALIFAALDVAIDGAQTFTPGAGYTELVDVSPGASHPNSAVVYRIESPASGSYSPSATADLAGGYFVGISAAFGSSAIAWVLAPEVSDGDHGTYKAVTASDGGVIARVALDQAYRLATSSLRIGYGTAGATTIEIVGANAADFSDAVTLDSVTFTATGAYTSDTVAFALPNSTAYQYYRLEGDGDCRIYTWELYEANDAAAAAEIASHLTDPTDAHDASAISVADTGGHFAGTDVEAVLAELATNSGPDVELVTVAATGATETIDVSVARTYDLTMDQDVTLTLTGAVTAEAWFVTLLLRQDGTGGWDVTWPGSVEWATGSAPVIDPAANALTVVTLGTVDGGAVWLGFPTGGGGASIGATVEDETAWGIAPDAGVSTDASAADHTHGTPTAPAGELLVADVPVDFPHGTFFTTATQTVGSTTTAYAVAFAGEGDVDGLTHSTVTNNSRIYAQQSGEYNIIVTAIGDLTGGTNQHINVWLAIDNANVDNSNTIVQVVSTAETLIAASYNLDLTAGSYFEIKYQGDSTNCQLLQTAAAASPTRPASPAVLLTVNMEAPVAGFVSKGITLLLNDAGDDLLYADTA